MERNYKTLLIIINLIFVFSVLSIPTFMIFAEFADLGKINKSLTYKYRSGTPVLRKMLNLNTDTGIINVKYTTQAVDYLVRIDLNIEMAGPNLNGKSYLDFFDVRWDNFTSPLNFNLNLVSNKQTDFSKLHKANININVTLRADIIFDINISTIDGKIELKNLVGITVNNLFLSVVRGSIKASFTRCTIEGYITGTVNYGNITLKSYNNQYTQNSKFTINNVWGYILMDIYQYEEMSSNITGTMITKTGCIRVNYKDESPNVGGRFIFYNKTDFGSGTETVWYGFDQEILPSDAGQLYVSYDFPTQNNFDFSLNKFYNAGDFMWNLSSVPLTP